MNQPDGPSQNKLQDAAQDLVSRLWKDYLFRALWSTSTERMRREIRACAVRTWWGVQIVRSWRFVERKEL